MYYISTANTLCVWCEEEEEEEERGTRSKPGM